MAKKRDPSRPTRPKRGERGAIDEFFALESAPPAPVMDELEIRAATFPHPDELPDEALPAMLWRMLRALACMRTFILHTNHLGDRELYARLWRRDLREESFVATPRGMHGGFFLDLVGSGSDEDHDLYLRYHASAASRRFHAKMGENSRANNARHSIATASCRNAARPSTPARAFTRKNGTRRSRRRRSISGEAAWRLPADSAGAPASDTSQPVAA